MHVSIGHKGLMNDQDYYIESVLASPLHKLLPGYSSPGVITTSLECNSHCSRVYNHGTKRRVSRLKTLIKNAFEAAERVGKGKRAGRH